MRDAPHSVAVFRPNPDLMQRQMPGRGDVPSRPIRVLYSFPHKLGADRICYTAWQQVVGLDKAGAKVICMPGVLHRSVPDSIDLRPTLSFGSLRVPYRILGTMRALAIHDRIVAGRLEQFKDRIDVIHTWPDAALETLRAACRLGIPTVLERPNAHTRYAYESVAREARRLGFALPPNNEYSFKADVLQREEEEYRLADFLLCPSDFVQRTFLDEKYPKGKLLRHQYGFDDKVFRADPSQRSDGNRFTMLFAGDCAVRKGLHFALQAWLRSSACRHGRFLIAGRFLPEYAAKLRPMLAHPSIEVLGYRSDLPDLMRVSDVFVLPSIEEGSALVTSEARGSGCVLLVSQAAGAICHNGTDALVHPVGDVEMLSEHISALYDDRKRLQNMREASLSTVGDITWEAAARKLLEAYAQAIHSRTVSFP